MLILGRVLRNKVIPDGQAGQAVFEMDDQPFAGKYLESGRWIEICRRTSARWMPCRGGPRSRKGENSGQVSRPCRALPGLALR